MGCRPLWSPRVRASDVMPTGELLARVRRSAWDRACERAFAAAWPPAPEALAALGVEAGHLALAALIVLCPKVPRPRLASCLRLPPEAAWAVTQARRRPGWLRRDAAEIASAIRGAP